MKPALASLAALLYACSPRPEPEPPRPPLAAPPADAGPALPPAEKLPAGVLARAQGQQGVIEVVERGGVRQLLIDGAVHASVPVDGRAGADPVVALARALRSGGKTALVIGLGSGRTAGDLAAAGYEVEAVELEPVVIDYARRYFGYQGKAVAMDGAAFLAANPRLWDLVLMDAFTGDALAPPESLTSDAALERMGAGAAAGGLLVVRMLGEPTAPPVKALADRLRQGGPRRHVQLFGSGVGDERQNLYLVMSGHGINFVNAAGIAVWPYAGEPGWQVTAAGAGPAAPPAPARRVRLTGYVVRLRENGALALDLPHGEMGAMRYLLSGPGTAELAALVPASATFPTAGDIGSDGDTRGTLHEVLGGGGVKRSDVRFSPVAAVVEGSATLRSVVHPDASAAVPGTPRGNPPQDPLLPQGGALYDLSVDKVIWKADAAGWAKVGAGMDAAAADFARALTRPVLDQDSPKPLIRMRMVLRQHAVPDFLPPAREVVDLLRAVDAATPALPHWGPNSRGGSPRAAPPPTPPLARAIFCDRIQHQRDIEPSERLTPAVIAVDRAALRCAIAAYEKVAADRKHPQRLQAAGRAFVLWDDTVDWQDPRTEKAAMAAKAALHKKYSDLTEQTEPLAP